MVSTPKVWPWWFAPLGLALGCLLPIGAVAELGRFAGHYPVGVGTIIVELFFVAVALGLARAKGRVERGSFALRAMRITPGRAGLWILLGLICVLLVDALYLAAVPHPGHIRLYRHSPSGFDAWIVMFAAIVAAPVGEELFFRGFFHRTLRTRLAVLPAVAISASLFGLMHWWFGDPIGTVFPRVAAGVLLAMLLERTGSLYPGMACHATFNLSVAVWALPGYGANMLWIAPLAWIVAILMSLKDPRRKRNQRRREMPAPARVPESLERPEWIPRV